MTIARRSFATTRALQRLHPGLLRDVLAKFPSFVKDHKLALPTDPKPKDLDYEAIRTSIMSGDLPDDLDNVLSYASILGTTEGWERIKKEAEVQRIKIPFSPDGLTHADLAMKVWLETWPKHPHLLEQSYARARVHSKSSYTYYPPVRDVRSHYKTPTDAILRGLRSDLNKYFESDLMVGKGTNVLMFEYDKETWFLIRYPEHLERKEVYEEDGTAKTVEFKPREYDAVVYNRVFGDIRMNTRRKQVHTKYRILFGHALLGTENVFAVHKKLISMEPLKGPCLSIFNTDDIDGLADIAPAEICFQGIGEPNKEITWQADKDTSLLDHNPHHPLLLPDDTDTVHYAVFRYRLRDKTKYHTLRVQQGNTMNYERDGDSVVLEEWLRKRGFVRDMLVKKAK
jgi:hypothetical protein